MDQNWLSFAYHHIEMSQLFLIDNLYPQFTSLWLSCLQQAYKSGNAKSGGGLALKDSQKSQAGFSFLFVILVGLLGMLVGYLLGG